MPTVKLLHWNILYTEKAENILSLVKEVNPDIFCCQEISDKNPRSQQVVNGLSKLFKFNYFEAADITGSTGELLQLGNAIFSNFPITDHKTINLWNGPNTISGNISEQRVYIEVRLNIAGRELTVGTTHLSFAPYFADTSDRQKQAVKLMSAIVDHKSNYVITGDFNSAPNTKIISSIEKQLVSAGPPHSQPSFTTIPFSFLGFEVKGLEWRVDYIFTSHDIQVSSSQIINTKSSDHLPIVAELQI
jgi:endonuclease/exonuclease/phosphatase family metal-dependent hydrolase